LGIFSHEIGEKTAHFTLGLGPIFGDGKSFNNYAYLWNFTFFLLNINLKILPSTDQGNEHLFDLVFLTH
jgi:hypothetical protein